MVKRQNASTGEIVDDGTGVPVAEPQSKIGKHTKHHKSASDNLTMHVKVYSPFRTYFDSAAHSLTAENITGQFDILPKHHNFITLLNACEVLVRTPEGEQKIRISGGVMHVKADEVIIFLDV